MKFQSYCAENQAELPQMHHHAYLKKFVMAKNMDPAIPRNQTLPCHDIYVKKLYDKKFWLTFHINAKFNFKTEKWIYPTKEVWLHHKVTIGNKSMLTYLAPSLHGEFSMSTQN